MLAPNPRVEQLEAELTAERENGEAATDDTRAD